jgi:hypothetical protein
MVNADDGMGPMFGNEGIRYHDIFAARPWQPGHLPAFRAAMRVRNVSDSAVRACCGADRGSA